jgi:hypothetical protein
MKPKYVNVLANYVAKRILGNRGDPQTDEYPGVWEAIIDVLRAHNRWDEKECFPIIAPCPMCGHNITTEGTKS